MKYTCPVCGYLTFNEPPGSNDICRVCGWEDDESQLRFPYTSGANKESLVVAQEVYQKRGYSNRNILMRLFVKDNPRNYQKDSNWRLLAKEDKVEEQQPGVEYGETYPKDPTKLYYWRK